MTLTAINSATERIGARSISTTGFSIADGGRAVVKYLVDESNLEQACVDLLGGAAIPERAGIQRKLPAAHPQWQWLFCDRIANIEGLGFKQKVNSRAEEAIGIFVEAEPIQYYARYKQYEITAEFSPRPYPVLLDTSIPRKFIVYYKDDGAAQNDFYASEWLRYVEIVEKPAAEYLTAVNGQLVFKMDVNPGWGDIKDKAVPGGQLRQLIQSVMLEVKWHQVPYSFLLSTNSYIDRCMGRVNQNAWNNYPAGSLLLHSMTVDRVYTPPFPEWIPFNGAFVPSQQKMCDLTFHMMKKNIAPKQAYTVTNNSHVPYGHNVIFNTQDTNWYYVENKVSGLPLYPSFPFELLFTNPDQ